MNGKKVISACYPLCEKVVTELGYVLVDIEYKKQVSGMVLELFIDSENGITLDDCEKVSRALDDPLDDLNPTNDESYTLNVSSLGLDRPLTTEYQFNKYKDQLVEFKFYEPFQPYNVKIKQGWLKGWDEDNVAVMFDTEHPVFIIPRKKIAQIVPVIEF